MVRSLAGLMAAVVCFGQSRAPAIDSIVRDEPKADVYFLASDAGPTDGDAGECPGG